VIVHRGSELSFCGELGDYDDREHTHGLWAFDYAHGQATLAYPMRSEPRLLLPKSDDIAALGPDRELGIAGPAGWLAPPAKLDLEASGKPRFHVAGIVWRGDQAHVLAIREPGKPDELEPSPVARELVVGNPKLTTALDVARAARATAIAQYSDGQWWVVVHDLEAPRWVGLDHGDKPVTGTTAWVSGWQTQHLAAGVLGEFVMYAVDGDTIAELPRRDRTPHRIAWDGPTLRRVDPNQVDDTTDRITVASKTVDLHWRSGGRDAYEVWIGDPSNAVAAIPARSRHRPRLALVAAASGYYLTDGDGRYATLDSAFRRTDPWDIWEYLRSSDPDEDRETVPVRWPDRWRVRGLAFALYGFPAVALLVVAIALRRGRGRSPLPVAAIAPAPRLDLSSRWTIVLLGLYAIGATIALALVLPRLAP
jgi:hypothetical protein